MAPSSLSALGQVWPSGPHLTLRLSNSLQMELERALVSVSPMESPLAQHSFLPLRVSHKALGTKAKQPTRQPLKRKCLPRRPRSAVVAPLKCHPCGANGMDVSLTNIFRDACSTPASSPECGSNNSPRSGSLQATGVVAQVAKALQACSLGRSSPHWKCPHQQRYPLESEEVVFQGSQPHLRCHQKLLKCLSPLPKQSKFSQTPSFWWDRRTNTPLMPIGALRSLDRPLPWKIRNSGRARKLGPRAHRLLVSRQAGVLLVPHRHLENPSPCNMAITDWRPHGSWLTKQFWTTLCPKSREQLVWHLLGCVYASWTWEVVGRDCRIWLVY